MGGVVAVLSVACIYLSGLVVGNYMAQQKPQPVSTVYVPRLSAAPSVPVADVPAQPDWFTQMRMQEIKTFLADIQKLETQRRAVLQSHAATMQNTPQPQTLALTEEPTAMEPRLPLPVARVPLEQLHTESSHMQQLRANMEGLRAPEACITLRFSYNAYWREITAWYDKLLSARHSEESDPASSREIMEFLYSTGVENLRAAAKKADQDLTFLCNGQRIAKPFTID